MGKEGTTVDNPYDHSNGDSAEREATISGMTNSEEIREGSE